MKHLPSQTREASCLEASWKTCSGKKVYRNAILGAEYAAQAFYADTLTPVIQRLLLEGFLLLSKKAT